MNRNLPRVLLVLVTSAPTFCLAQMPAVAATPIPLPPEVQQIVDETYSILNRVAVVRGPAVPDASKTVIARLNFAPGLSVITRTRSGTFEKVGINSLQAVSVTLQFPPAMALSTIRAEALDGGTVTTGVTPITARCRYSHPIRRRLGG